MQLTTTNAFDLSEQFEVTEWISHLPATYDSKITHRCHAETKPDSQSQRSSISGGRKVLNLVYVQQQNQLGFWQPDRILDDKVRNVEMDRRGNKLEGGF